MGIVANAVVLAEEVAHEAEGLSPYVFGGAAFLILGALLIVTLMLKVGE